jgi:hypothetical protein
VSALLLFFICAGPTDEVCIDGELRATSCAAAVAYLMAGLQPGQILHVMGCEE